MISDEQRMEAVKFLRDRICLKLDCRECHQMSKTLLGDEAALCAVSDHWERLADLIDRPTITRHGRFKTKYGRETPCCEVCGYSIGDMRWNYCPKCGARILEVSE